MNPHSYRLKGRDFVHQGKIEIDVNEKAVFIRTQGCFFVYTNSDCFLNSFVYAIIALSINESAYIAEVFRGALASVNVGQIEAASAIGMTYFQTFRRIIFPEMLSVALPGLGNSFIGLIKGTSLAFVCAVVEMTAQGKIIGGRTYRYFEVYVSLAIIYWVITFVIEQGIRLIEKKMQIPEQVAKVEISEDERGV